MAELRTARRRIFKEPDAALLLGFDVQVYLIPTLNAMYKHAGMLKSSLIDFHSPLAQIVSVALKRDSLSSKQRQYA